MAKAMTVMMLRVMMTMMMIVMKGTVLRSRVFGHLLPGEVEAE